LRTIVDRDCLLSAGLEQIRGQFRLPSAFPAEVEGEAVEAARKRFDEHSDATSVPFVTLDPAQSRDLDQAFAIEEAGNDVLLHYAIADVGWFVAPDGAISRAADLSVGHSITTGITTTPAGRIWTFEQHISAFFRPPLGDRVR